MIGCLSKVIVLFSVGVFNVTLLFSRGWHRVFLRVCHSQLTDFPVSSGTSCICSSSSSEAQLRYPSSRFPLVRLSCGSNCSRRVQRRQLRLLWCPSDFSDFSCDRRGSLTRRAQRAHTMPSSVLTRCSSVRPLLLLHAASFHLSTVLERDLLIPFSPQVDVIAHVRQLPPLFHGGDHPWARFFGESASSPRNEPSCVTDDRLHQCAVNCRSVLCAVLWCGEQRAHVSLQQCLVVFNCSTAMMRSPWCAADVCSFSYLGIHTFCALVRRRLRIAPQSDVGETNTVHHFQSRRHCTHISTFRVHYDGHTKS